MKKNFIFALLGIGLICSVGIFSVCSKGNNGQQGVRESELPIRAESDSEKGEKIRILLKGDEFAGITHNKVVYQIGKGKKKVIKPDDKRFKKGSIQISGKQKSEQIKILSLNRACGHPVYRGTLELFSTAEGIVIVNEVSMEEYLYAVVPSEMPASYELEALKAQAVCARSYAYNQSREYSYPEYRAHVDDSTSFQVYGNLQEYEQTTKAVKETRGEKIWYGKQVATAYYYSTSCGKSTDMTVWGTKKTKSNRYLTSVSICNEEGEDYEREYRWYRWKAVVPEELMSDLIELNTQTELGELQKLTVSKVGPGGVALEITAFGSEGKVVVEKENQIRAALGGSGYVIETQDGSQTESTSSLPSAFFTIQQEEGNYIISGGGHGHGIGMSQNGANEMAKQGKTYREILMHFYTGIDIR